MTPTDKEREAQERAQEAQQNRQVEMRSGLTIADYEEVLADHRRLVRELDVLLNGEEGAAKQASLCDIVAQLAAKKRLPSESAQCDATPRTDEEASDGWSGDACCVSYKFAQQLERELNRYKALWEACHVKHEAERNRRMELEAAQTWQPIETAPKDGTWVLLCGGSCEGDESDTERIVTGQYTNYLNGRTTEWHWQFAWYDGGYYGVYESPTHWMPLPAAPTPEEK